MTDIVERLRDRDIFPHAFELTNEAADEIERLCKSRDLYERLYNEKAKFATTTVERLERAANVIEAARPLWNPANWDNDTNRLKLDKVGWSFGHAALAAYDGTDDG